MTGFVEAGSVALFHEGDHPLGREAKPSSLKPEALGFRVLGFGF